MKYLYITFGGALGCLLRYLAVLVVGSRLPSSFPYGTFFVNITGALLIGLLFGYFSVHDEVSERVRFLLMIGFLGGFTTFSSFAFENMRLLSIGMLRVSLIYILLSNVLGVAMVFAGYYTGLRLK